MSTISLLDLYTFSHAQLVWISKSIGIACYAECIDNTGKSVFKLNTLPKQIICQRLLDYFNNSILYTEPIYINYCHYSSYINRAYISFSINDFVLINKFCLDNWNCRAFIRKCGINASYQLINDFVHSQWIQSSTPFTYRDMQIRFVDYITRQQHITTPTDSSQFNIKNSCLKILNHSYIPTVKLILQNTIN